MSILVDVNWRVVDFRAPGIHVARVFGVLMMLAGTAPAQLLVPKEAPTPALTQAPKPETPHVRKDTEPTPRDSSSPMLRGKPGSANDPGSPVPVDLLLARWMELAKTASREKPNTEEGVAIARDLAKSGTAALSPLYDVLADKATSPFAKALAAMSLMTSPDTGQAARIIAMTTLGNDLTTRVCATSLLGSIPCAESDAALNALKADTERQVRFQALRGLALRSPEGRKAFADLYRLPDTTPTEKGDIVSVLSSDPASGKVGE